MAGQRILRNNTTSSWTQAVAGTNSASQVEGKNLRTLSVSSKRLRITGTNAFTLVMQIEKTKPNAALFQNNTQFFCGIQVAFSVTVTSFIVYGNFHTVVSRHSPSKSLIFPGIAFPECFAFLFKKGGLFKQNPNKKGLMFFSTKWFRSL